MADVQDKIDIEWRDICNSIGHSGLVTWTDWITLGGPEPRYAA